MPSGPIYLTVDEFKLRSILMPEQINKLINARPGYIERRIDQRSRKDIDARLRKRYAAPFEAFPATPAAVLEWLVVLVTKDVLLALGTNANDEQVQDIIKAADVAEAELKEAADEENGLFDLPIDDDKTASALTEAEPLGMSEASPYDWIDREADRITRGGLP